jgi:flavorubredoxin
MFHLTPSITVTSVLNPNMRIFDVIMHTDYGTSYNSYIVRGSEGIALIDTAHLTFEQNYLENVESSLDGLQPRYLVVNHTEPDHSGSISALLERYPELTILATQAAAIYLKQITNIDDPPIKIVKDGDSVSLGDKTLEFRVAPFLHWPDTMMTWCPEEKVLFTCDFLGAHYCEPQLLDSRVVYQEAYEAAAQIYYQAIFSPFKEYVLKGLDRIADLDIEYVCASHGPILSKGVCLEAAMENYRIWSQAIANETMLIPIFYCSAYGNTEKLAKTIAEGMLDVIPDAQVFICELTGLEASEMDEMAALMHQSDAFLIGSPTINRDAVPPVWDLLSRGCVIGLSKKPTAVFGSFGWSGEAAKNISERLAQLKTKVYETNMRANFVPSQSDINMAREFGKNFANSLLGQG